MQMLIGGTHVIVAIIVLILGILFGNFLSAIVRTAAFNAGLTAAEGLAKTSLYANSLDHYVIRAA
jgi:hypothetical protein